MQNNDEYLSKQVLVLAGGGIDSSVCVQMLRRENCLVRTLHVNYGQKSSDLEWASVKKISQFYCCSSSQVNITGLNFIKKKEIIGRNAALIFLGLMNIKQDESGLCIGIHKGTGFYDCSTLFYEQVSRLVQEYTDASVSLLAPLLSFSKPEIIAYAKLISLPFDLTYSCQNGILGGCGKCHSCLDRERFGC